ncbi:MAG: hypothetical protein D6763_12080 [Alphaproteobacteria bacterium]|nr:MAG: hypothetical protein D6763_12080 [Alphaproteobacteria bacterium]
MFGKDMNFAQEQGSRGCFWTGTGWKEDRRRRVDHRLGRRRSDSHFPFNPAFVVQVLARDKLTQARGGPAAQATGGYVEVSSGTVAGRRLELLA